MSSQSRRSSSKNWTFVSPRSSVALTRSVVGGVGRQRRGGAGRGPGERRRAVVERAAGRGLRPARSRTSGEIMSSVSAITVSMPPLQITVSGEPSREVIRSSCGPPSRTSAPSPPVMIALAADDGQPVAAAVAGDGDGLRRRRRPRPRRSRCRCRSGRSRRRVAVVGAAPSSENDGRDAPAVDGGVDPVAADHRVGAGVGLSASLPSPPRSASSPAKPSMSSSPAPPSMVSLRAPPASASLPSPPVMVAGIVLRPRSVAVVSR